MKTTTLLIILASLTLAVAGQIPSNYQRARNITDPAEKKRFVLGLSRASQAALWSEHFAYVRANEDLDREQRVFLGRSLDAFEHDELTDEIDDEAKELFPRELGGRVFIPGPFDCQAKNLTREIRETTLRRESVFTFASFANFRGQKTSFADCDCRMTATA